MTWNFKSCFHELFPTLPDSFSLAFIILLKPSHFTKSKIYVKLDPKAANTGCFYYLKSGTIYSKWN